MFKKIYFLFMVGFLMSCSKTSSLKLDIEEYSLTNGLHVILAPTHSQFTTVTIQYAVGGAFETPEQLGLSHLLEHLMFKTTKHLKTGEFNYILENQLGGSFNAMTTYDSTIYHETVLAEYTPKVLELEAERMVNLALDPIEVKKEKQVVLEEMRNRIENSDIGFLFDKAGSIFYGNQYPYGRDLGGRENILSISDETIHNYYKSHYAPNNATLIITGKIIDSIKNDIQKHFGSLEKLQLQKKDTPTDFTPNTGTFYIQRDVNTSYVMMLKKIPAATDVLTPSLNILASLLTDGNTSLFIQELVQKESLVSSINVMTDSSKLPSSFIILYNPYNIKDVPKIEQKIDDLLQQLLNDKNLEAKIHQTQLSSATDFYTSLQDSSELGVSIAQGISVANDPLFYMNLQTKKIISTDIKKSVDYLKDEKWGVFIMEKKKESDKD